MRLFKRCVKSFFAWYAAVAIIVALNGCARTRISIIEGTIVKGETKLTASEIEIERPRKPFEIGEELTYEMAWLNIPVGTIVIRVKGDEVINSKAVYVIEATVTTKDFFSMLYSASGSLTSYIDKDSFASIKHVVLRKKGRRRHNKYAVECDYKTNKAYYTNLLTNAKATFDIPGPVQDPLSAIYFFRSKNVDIGDRLEYKLINEKKMYYLVAIVEQKTLAKLWDKSYKGAFSVNFFATTTRDGDGDRKNTATSYFTCDSNRVPIYGLIRKGLLSITVTLAHRRAST